MSLTYLHTMIRVKDLEKTIAFFELLGLKETRRLDSEKGRFSLIFLAPPGQEDCLKSKAIRLIPACSFEIVSKALLSSPRLTSKK